MNPRQSDSGVCEHTPEPTGYLQWHAWAEEKAKTHIQERCPVCGLWAIWVPTDTVEVVDVRAEVSYRAVCARCEEAPDDDGGEYQATPEKAERLARAHGYERVDGRLVCEDCRHPEED